MRKTTIVSGTAAALLLLLAAACSSHSGNSDDGDAGDGGEEAAPPRKDSGKPKDAGKKDSGKPHDDASTDASLDAKKDAKDAAKEAEAATPRPPSWVIVAYDGVATSGPDQSVAYSVDLLTNGLASIFASPDPQLFVDTSNASAPFMLAGTTDTVSRFDQTGGAFDPSWLVPLPADAGTLPSSDPYGVAVTATKVAYVLRYDSNVVDVIDPSGSPNGAAPIDSVDLSSLLQPHDYDGKVEVTSAVYVAKTDRLYLALANLDRGAGSVVGSSFEPFCVDTVSTIVAIDTKTKELVSIGDGPGGSIALQGYDPVRGGLSYDAKHDRLIVLEAGCQPRIASVGDAGDAAIESGVDASEGGFDASDSGFDASGSGFDATLDAAGSFEAGEGGSVPDVVIVDAGLPLPDAGPPGAVQRRGVEAVDLKTGKTSILLDASDQAFPVALVAIDETHAALNFVDGTSGVPVYGAFAWDPTSTTIGDPLPNAPTLFDYDGYGNLVGAIVHYGDAGAATTSDVVALDLATGTTTTLRAGITSPGNGSLASVGIWPRP